MKVPTTIYNSLCAVMLTIMLASGVHAATEVISSPTEFEFGIMLADTRGMERRDDRRDDRQGDRDDRQDCREEEGILGKDKRDCKQDARRDDRHD